MPRYLVLALLFFAFFPITAQDRFPLVGYATMNGGTTGGAGGDTVEVSTLSGLRNYATASDPYVIIVNDGITGSDEYIEVTSDKSILGCGTDAHLQHLGFEIDGESNIIIRNLRMSYRVGGDLIRIINNSHNVWVDHCELYNDMDNGKDYYDGLLDVTKDASYFTFSWNYFHDHYKALLVGASDDDNHDRKITYHHNYLENLGSRMPSFRYGNGHIFNNLYLDCDDAINSRMGACLRIESNHFENLDHTITTRYSNQDGNWDINNNNFINVNQQPTSSTCTWNAPYDYSSVLQPVNSVKDSVLANAGVGVIHSCPFPTPVKLVAFNGAYKKDINAVELTWQTSEEKENAYFEVLHSRDGEKFTKRGRVEGENTSNGSDYRFIDQKASSGTHYYRLVQYDHDGSREVLKTISVQAVQRGPSVELHPNPFVDYINLHLKESENQGHTITVSNAQGKVLKQGKVESGKTYKAGKSLPAGVYILKIQGRDWLGTYRIIKKSY